MRRTPPRCSNFHRINCNQVLNKSSKGRIITIIENWRVINCKDEANEKLSEGLSRKERVMGTLSPSRSPKPSSTRTVQRASRGKTQRSTQQKWSATHQSRIQSTRSMAQSTWQIRQICFSKVGKFLRTHTKIWARRRKVVQIQKMPEDQISNHANRQLIRQRLIDRHLEPLF